MSAALRLLDELGRDPDKESGPYRGFIHVPIHKRCDSGARSASAVVQFLKLWVEQLDPERLWIQITEILGEWVDLVALSHVVWAISNAVKGDENGAYQ